MHRLRDAYAGRRAAVIFGGPSLIEQRVDFARLKKTDLVVFVDTQALTPALVRSGIEPDYLLMCFPEKAKANGLQNFIFRAMLAGFNARPVLKRQHGPVWEDLHDHLERYCEPWRPHRGVHKRYRWKPDVYLPDSPFALLAQISTTPVIANGRLLREHFPQTPVRNPLYVFEEEEALHPFSLDRYYAPQEANGTVRLWQTSFLNSAAIAVFPLLRFMGFHEAFLLGMDMSMLGAMEYAALYTFRSMWHFRWYFAWTQRAFNARYRPNRPFYFRPRSEFEDARAVLTHPALRVTRVYDPWKYAAPLEGVPTVSLEQFFRR